MAVFYLLFSKNMKKGHYLKLYCQTDQTLSIYTTCVWVDYFYYNLTMHHDFHSVYWPAMY